MKRPSPTRAPKRPPFRVGTRVRYLGRDHITASFDLQPNSALLVKYHGMIVSIARVVLGTRGTGRQLRDQDGPMYYEDTEEPILDETRDGYSVYELVDANGRIHGRVIDPASKKEWEVVP